MDFVNNNIIMTSVILAQKAIAKNLFYYKKWNPEYQKRSWLAIGITVVPARNSHNTPASNGY